LHITRENIRDEAFVAFGLKTEYDTRLGEWKLLLNRELSTAMSIILFLICCDKRKIVVFLANCSNTVKDSVPNMIDPATRSAAIRMLKSVILDGGTLDDDVPRAARKDENGCYDLDEV
jgi:hypothetical protein